MRTSRTSCFHAPKTTLISQRYYSVILPRIFPSAARLIPFAAAGATRPSAYARYARPSRGPHVITFTNQVSRYTGTGEHLVNANLGKRSENARAAVGRPEAAAASRHNGSMAHRERFAAAMTAITRRLPFGLSEVVAPSLVGYLLINLCTFFVDLGLLGLFHGTVRWPIPVAVTLSYGDRLACSATCSTGCSTSAATTRSAGSSRSSSRSARPIT